MHLKVEVGRFSPAITEILPKKSAQCRARFYTAPMANSSAGYKTLPYKGNLA